MNKKFKLIIGSLAFFIVIVICFVFLLADSYNYLFSIESLKMWEKSHVGGIVVNSSHNSIEIVDNIAIVTIPSGKTSRQKGVFDVDRIVIKRPTKFQGEIYKNGVIKFCDFAKMEVISNGNIDEIKPSFLYNLCILFEGEVGWSSRLGSGYVRL